MDKIYIIIAFLLAIVVSDLLSKIFNKVDLIFIQILMGIIISFLPFFREFQLNPELFMLIIIKPLIFNEAQKLSINELKKYFKPIFSLSLFFVVISVIIMGVMVNNIIPEISLSTAFIIAAIIIPTNSGIVKSLSEKLQFPKHTFHILEGESLFNDSIAILIFELALSVNLTKKFELNELIYEFFFVILGGILVGAILGFIIIRVRYYITKFNFETPSMLVVIQLITPFVVYIISEHYLHVSGIIAVIISGIMHGIERPLLNLKSTKLQVISNSTWEVISYILDGSVAILLGLILPSILENIIKYDITIFIKLLFMAIFIYIVFVSLRFLWVLFQQQKFMINNKNDKYKQSFIYAISGVHGTLNLVIALLLPETTNNSNIFVFREELIFISLLVVLISIMIPAILFPIILTHKEEIKYNLNFNEVRSAMIKHTISEIENSSDNKNDHNIAKVVKILRGQLIFLDKGELLKPDRSAIIKLLEDTNKIEINVVNDMINKGEVSKKVGLFYKAYIMNPNKFGLRATLFNLRMSRIKKKVNMLSVNNNDYKTNFIIEFNHINKASCRSAISYLNSIKDNTNYKNIEFVINYYNRRLGKEINEFNNIIETQSLKDVLLNVFQIENIFINDYLEKGLISDSLANELREQISYDQLVYLK